MPCYAARRTSEALGVQEVHLLRHIKTAVLFVDFIWFRCAFTHELGYACDDRIAVLHTAARQAPVQSEYSFLIPKRSLGDKSSRSPNGLSHFELALYSLRGPTSHTDLRFGCGCRKSAGSAILGRARRSLDTCQLRSQFRWRP